MIATVSMMRAMIDARTTKTMMITVSILLSLPVSRSDVVGSTTVAEINNNKKAVLPQGNRAMPQVFFSVEVRQQHSLQV